MDVIAGWGIASRVLGSWAGGLVLARGALVVQTLLLEPFEPAASVGVSRQGMV